MTIERGEASQNTDVALIAQAMADKVVCPIFSVSNVTGEGIPLLKTFISKLQSRVHSSG